MDAAWAQVDSSILYVDDEPAVLVGVDIPDYIQPYLLIVKFGVKRADGTTETVVDEVENIARDGQSAVRGSGRSPAALSFCRLFGQGPLWEVQKNDSIVLSAINVSTQRQNLAWAVKLEHQCMLHEDCRISPRIGYKCLSDRCKTKKALTE